MDQPEGQLFEAAARGDSRALEALLERHMPGLRSFVRLRAGPVIRAKESQSDLVQSVCREILQHRERYQYDGEAGFRYWLYSTALRKIVDKHRYYAADKRSVGRERRLDTGSGLLDSYATFCTPSREAAIAEEIARVEAAFDALPEDAREVITLHRIVGPSYREIGTRQGKTEKQARGLVARALSALAEQLRAPQR